MIGLVGRSGYFKVINGGVLHLFSPSFIQNQVPLISIQIYSMASFLPVWVILVVSAFELDRPIDVIVSFPLQNKLLTLDWFQRLKYKSKIKIKNKNQKSKSKSKSKIKNQNYRKLISRGTIQKVIIIIIKSI